MQMGVEVMAATQLSSSVVSTWAEILAVMFFVLARIEQTANLVDPTLALVALYPTFFVYFVVLPLFEIALHDCGVDELDRNTSIGSSL
jgi:hypothetical protein